MSLQQDGVLGCWRANVTLTDDRLPTDCPVHDTRGAKRDAAGRMLVWPGDSLCCCPWLLPDLARLVFHAHGLTKGAAVRRALRKSLRQAELLRGQHEQN